MKQKIVLKVDSMADYKCRKKALLVAAGLSGVVWFGATGEEKRQLEVIGDDIDIPKLTKLLRMKVGCAEIVSVGPHPPPKPPQPPKPQPLPKPHPEPKPQPCFCALHPCVCILAAEPHVVWIGEPCTIL